MGYSKGKTTTAFFLSTVILVGFVSFFVLSQVAVALLPVLGIGGIMLNADSFDGENGTVYPQKGELAEHPDRVTDTVECEERPMIVFDLDRARVDSYQVFKDIKLPYFEDWWMTVVIDQPEGSIEATSAQIFTTQIQIEELELINVEIREAGPDGESTDKWGPESGEFLMRGDPQGSTPAGEEDLFASGAVGWLHALTAEEVRFVGGAEPVELELSFQDSDDIQERYEEIGLLDVGGIERDDYFDCLPVQPEP